MENPKYILVMRQVASDYDGISHELFQIANNLERMDQFNPQQKLFSLPADTPCAEAVDTADGSWERTFTGREMDGCTAVCPAGSKVYFGAAGSASLLSARV